MLTFHRPSHSWRDDRAPLDVRARLRRGFVLAARQRVQEIGQHLYELHRDRRQQAVTS
jgi:hypothetical protein